MRGKKKIAIITGATSGFGKIFAEFTDTQFRGIDEFWLVGRNQERMEQVCRRMNHRTRPFLYDLSRMEDLIKLKSVLEKENPSIKILVNAAGFGVTGHVSDQDENVLAEMVDVNCRSVVEVSSLVLPYMKYRGRMIYMASAAAFLPQPGFAVYAASKAFVLSYVRALRAESREKQLRVTAVCPGAVKTEFFNRALTKKHLPAYKKLVMADPKKVIKKAWKDNEQNKEISVYGKAIKLTHLVTKILPHSLFLQFIGRK